MAKSFLDSIWVCVGNVVLEDGIWQDKVILTEFGQQARKLGIDTETGKIVNIE